MKGKAELSPQVVQAAGQAMGTPDWRALHIWAVEVTTKVVVVVVATTAVAAEETMLAAAVAPVMFRS